MQAAVNANVDHYLRTEHAVVGGYPQPRLTSAEGQPVHTDVAAGSYLLPLAAPATGDGHPADLPAFVNAAHVAANQAALEAYLPPGRRAGDRRTGDRRTKLSALIGVEVAAAPGHLQVTFPGDDPRAARLLAVLTADPELVKAWPLAKRNEKAITAYFQRSLTLLSATCPHLTRGVGTLLSEIVIAGKRGTGAASSSGAVGAVFFSPRAAWPESKYAELLVHEFVHQALFLEECVNGMYDPSADLDAPDALVISAVLKIPRSYEKSFHAAWVAYVQRRLYHRLGIADPKPPGDLSATLEGLHARQDVLTDNGRALLAELTALDAAYPPDEQDQCERH